MSRYYFIPEDKINLFTSWINGNDFKNKEGFWINPFVDDIVEQIPTRNGLIVKILVAGDGKYKYTIFENPFFKDILGEDDV